MATTWPSFTKIYHHEPYATILPTQKHLNCRDLSVLITGAGTGIGQAIAVAYAQAQARGIILLGRTESTLQETAALIKKTGEGNTEVLVVTADITQLEAVQAAFSKAQEKFETIDVLVNNAGGSLASGSVAEIDLGNFWKTFELNVLGPMTVTQTFIKAANSSKSPEKQRTVINLPSGAAHIPYAPKSVAYSCSKMACAKLAEFVHHEHRDWRVFNLQPGVVATALAKQAGRKGEDMPELCASMAVWLTRDPRALDLNGRFLWSNWDVDELLSMKDEINEKDILVLGLKGWADDYTADGLLARAKAVLGNANKE